MLAYNNEDYSHVSLDHYLRRKVNLSKTAELNRNL